MPPHIPTLRSNIPEVEWYSKFSIDASYLSEPKARSCVGGHFSGADKHVGKDIPIPNPNGPINAVSNILQNVMSSDGEAEVADLFQNCKDRIVVSNTLIETAIHNQVHPSKPMFHSPKASAPAESSNIAQKQLGCNFIEFQTKTSKANYIYLPKRNQTFGWLFYQ